MYVRKKMSIRKSGGFQVYKRRRSEISSQSDTSTSSNDCSRNSSKPLKRFNRLFRSSLARHWLFFKKTRLSAGLRGRSVSDAGLCSIVDHDLDPDYLDISTSCSHRSLQAIGSEASRDSFDLAPSPLSRSAAGSSSVGVEEASDGSDAERSKKGQYLRVPAPAFPGQSTGNFASGAAGGGGGAARSAPATPLQLEPHPRTSKHDKNPVKPLSGSVPSVRAATAQGDASVPKHPYKARQKKFQRHFPQVGPEERVLDYYSCALVGDLLLQGHLYITKNYFAFYSNVFGYVTKLLIPTTSVLRITKEKIARIIPNAVGVCTRDERHVFGSLLSRDATYKLMLHVWKAARVPELVPDPPDVRTSEVELDASEYSPGDDSSSGGGADQPDAPAAPARRDSEAIVATGGGAAIIQPVLLAGAAGAAGVAGAGAGGGWRWARGVLLAATVLLACSAALLAHRLYGLPSGGRAQDDVHKLSGQALYSELVRWRARLHGQAATELHAFLTTNMLLLTKVRQSLEALSGEIMTDNVAQGAPHINIEVPNDTVFS